MNAIYVTKAEALAQKQELQRELISGVKGTATLMSFPTSYTSGYLYEKYNVYQAGDYINFKNEFFEYITVTEADLLGNFVFIEVLNGVAKKVTIKIPSNIYNITEVNNNYTLDPSQIVPSEALYADDSLAGDILKRIDKNTGENVNYKEVTNWVDGTEITDSKVDNFIYIKKGTKYYVWTGFNNYDNIAIERLGVTNTGDQTININNAFEIAKNLGITVKLSDNKTYTVSNRIYIPANLISDKGILKSTYSGTFPAFEITRSNLKIKGVVFKTATNRILLRLFDFTKIDKCEIISEYKTGGFEHAIRNDDFLQGVEITNTKIIGGIYIFNKTFTTQYSGLLIDNCNVLVDYKHVPEDFITQADGCIIRGLNGVRITNNKMVFINNNRAFKFATSSPSSNPDGLVLENYPTQNIDVCNNHITYFTDTQSGKQVFDMYQATTKIKINNNRIFAIGANTIFENKGGINPIGKYVEIKNNYVEFDYELMYFTGVAKDENDYKQADIVFSGNRCIYTLDAKAPDRIGVANGLPSPNPFNSLWRFDNVDHVIFEDNVILPKNKKQFALIGLIYTCKNFVFKNNLYGFGSLFFGGSGAGSEGLTFAETAIIENNNFTFLPSNGIQIGTSFPFKSFRISNNICEQAVTTGGNITLTNAVIDDLIIIGNQRFTFPIFTNTTVVTNTIQPFGIIKGVFVHTALGFAIDEEKSLGSISAGTISGNADYLWRTNRKSIFDNKKITLSSRANPTGSGVQLYAKNNSGAVVDPFAVTITFEFWFNRQP